MNKTMKWQSNGVITAQPTEDIDVDVYHEGIWKARVKTRDCYIQTGYENEDLIDVLTWCKTKVCEIQSILKLIREF